MIRRSRLGFVVGAFLSATPFASRAQVVVPPASEVPIPPKPRTDSGTAKPDTLKAPFGRLETPRTADIGPQYQWNREQLFSSGAYTVADLLERIPGATSFRTGWLASPKFVAMNGDMRRVTILYDGIEMDNLDTRNGGMLDLTTIELWTLEYVAVERFANELRVHLRSWRTDRTDPYTRTDLYTGDEQTNLFRGFYGKRFASGAGLQLAGQQFGTRSARFGGGGDALSFMGRVGVARKLWSVDAFAVRRNSSRVIQPTFGTGLSLPPFEGTHTLAYLRAAAGNPSGGPWIQATASGMQLAESSPFVSPADALSRRIRPDSADTTTKRMQYVIAAGVSRGLIRASVTDRVRAYEGLISHSPAVRMEFGSNLGLLGLYGERDGRTKRRRADGVFRFSPMPFFAVSGAASVDSPSGNTELPPGSDPDALALYAGIPSTTSARIEAGIRIGSPWLVAGYITRDTAVLAPPAAFDSSYTVRIVGRRQGLYAGLRGAIYKDLNVEALATRWDSAGFYQPRYQARSEINLDTRWLSRFRSGTFAIKLAAIHEYRSEVSFPTADGSRFTGPSNVFSALVELRILRGVASYQVRNMFGELNQIVPEFYMPRSIGVYGIRWDFWN